MSFVGPGLTAADVAARRARDGPNELPAPDKRGVVTSLLAIVREPMSLLILACGGVYLVLGDLHEALVLLGFVVFMMTLTFVQERKSERALESLRHLASPRALVVRDGRRVRVAGSDLVKGDLVVLAEGDRVPADATVLTERGLSIDESLMTGESVPVRKVTGDPVRTSPTPRPGGDEMPFVYAGTLVTSGSGIARIHATGPRTEIARLESALDQRSPQRTRLQLETRRLVVKLAWIAGVLSIVATVGYALATGKVLPGVLAGLTLAMALLPNEVPVVVTMFLALGARRLSARKVLTRRIPAVEALGSVTVLCVDKTGTLTQNRMRVSRVCAGGLTVDVERSAGDRSLTGPIRDTVEAGVLATARSPSDPMDLALRVLAPDLGDATMRWELVREHPVCGTRRAVVRLWRRPGHDRVLVGAKGAPESIAEMCAPGSVDRKALERDVAELAAGGLRVLAVARSEVDVAASGLPPEALGLRLVGLVGLLDPLREGVREAVKECRLAGIRVVMITGDYPATAQAIARRAGIDAERTVTGAELAVVSDEDLRARVADTSVFARMLPEQKLRLVLALEDAGEVVGMTGDGVNDAPALRAADIGVAMGARGSDVAREAASVVLLEDDFASLVHGVRMGRRIVDNLRKALAYIVAVHLPIVGLTLVPILLRWPLVLLPVHVAFLQLVIDPACTVVFEAQPEEADVMVRPPRDPRTPLFGRRVLGISLLQGASVLLVVLGVYAVALRVGETAEDARALTFASFIVSNLALIFTNRSWSRVIAASKLTDPTLWIVSLGALALLAAVVYVPPLAALFRFAPLGALDVALCFGAGALGVAGFELMKLVAWRRRGAGAPPPARAA